MTNTLRATAMIVAVLAALHGDSDQASAARLRRRACPKPTIPDHAYSSDHRSVAGEVLLQASTSRSLERKEGTDTTTVQVKWFNMSKPLLTVEHLRLDRIGLRLDDQGRCVFSGRITHRGPDDLPGSAVTVRLRAYAAATNVDDELVNAPLLWQSRARYVWVRRGEPQRIVVTTTDADDTTTLQRYYQEITHIEVELRYHEGR